MIMVVPMRGSGNGKWGARLPVFMTILMSNYIDGVVVIIDILTLMLVVLLVFLRSGYSSGNQVASGF